MMKRLLTAALLLLLIPSLARADESTPLEGTADCKPGIACKPAPLWADFGIDPFFTTRDKFNLYLPLRIFPVDGNFSFGGTYGFGDEEFYDVSIDYGQPAYTPWHAFLRWGERYNTKKESYYGRQYTIGIGYLKFVPLAIFARKFDWRNQERDQDGRKYEFGIGVELLRMRLLRKGASDEK